MSLANPSPTLEGLHVGWASGTLRVLPLLLGLSSLVPTVKGNQRGSGGIKRYRNQHYPNKFNNKILKKKKKGKRYPRGARDKGEPTDWAGMFGPTSVSQREEVTTHKGKGPIVKGKGEKEMGWGYWCPSLPLHIPALSHSYPPSHLPTL